MNFIVGFCLGLLAGAYVGLIIKSENDPVEITIGKPNPYIELPSGS